MLLALAAIALSSLLLLALCLRDPKRLRAARLKNSGMDVRTRRLMTVAALLPGLGLALTGDAAAFLMWLGGSAAIGWAITISFSPTGKGAS